MLHNQAPRQNECISALLLPNVLALSRKRQREAAEAGRPTAIVGFNARLGGPGLGQLDFSRTIRSGCRLLVSRLKELSDICQHLDLKWLVVGSQGLSRFEGHPAVQL